MSKITLYHYTDKKGAEGIRSSRFIKASQVETGDAIFGYGVYLTSMTPDKAKKEIAENNWDTLAKNAATRALNNGRVDYVVKVTLDASKVPKVMTTDRDIYLFEGDLYLSEGDTIDKV